MFNEYIKPAELSPYIYWIIKRYITYPSVMCSFTANEDECSYLAWHWDQKMENSLYLNSYYDEDYSIYF